MVGAPQPFFLFRRGAPLLEHGLKIFGLEIEQSAARHKNRERRRCRRGSHVRAPAESDDEKHQTRNSRGGFHGCLLCFTGGLSGAFASVLPGGAALFSSGPGDNFSAAWAISCGRTVRSCSSAS